MFNYENLSDVEFESLAKDIMEIKLGVNLQRFAKGRDGGVDLTNDVRKRELVVQVKHYYRSSVASLISSLKKEINKVRVINPQRYFVVTSATLSADKKDEIYEMFRDYMPDENSVITREDIEDFLQNEDNVEVVKRHFKLWLHSTRVLELVTSGDIETDSQVCIEQIKQNEKVLVQTQAYYEAINCLEATRVLFITGAPGVGKTITAQMLVLKYISEGYRLRYSTDTTDLSALKKSIFMNRDLPEIILLDDCFGQYYFRMKETQDSELVSLIRHIKISPNKVLILNSRLTILHEAKSISHEIMRCIDSDELHVHVIDMNRISILDKAKILYNHLFFSNIPVEYFCAVKNDNFYMKIILHKNYTPRIIEHVTTERHFASVQPAEYPQYILDVLNKPDEIWDNEYSKRIQQIDRIFLGTLFSLTNTSVDVRLFRDCFNYRLRLAPVVDLTEDNFKNCLSRLNMSMVKTIDYHGHKRIGVINPSVNDYLKNRLDQNKPERDEIIASIASIEQADKMLPDSNDFIKAKFIDRTILHFFFVSTQVKEDFLLAKVCEYEICDDTFSSIVAHYLHKVRVLCDSRGLRIIPEIDLLKRLLHSNLYSFYKVPNILKEQDVLFNMLDWYDFNDLVEAICQFAEKFDEDKDTLLLDALAGHSVESLVNAIDAYGFQVDISEETERYDIRAMIDANIDVDYETGDSGVDIARAASDLRREYEHDLRVRISEKLVTLPNFIRVNMPVEWNITFPVSDFEDVIRSALEPDIDDFEDRGPSTNVMMLEIDYMFRR